MGCQNQRRSFGLFYSHYSKKKSRNPIKVREDVRFVSQMEGTIQTMDVMYDKTEHKLSWQKVTKYGACVQLIGCPHHKIESYNIKGS